MDLVYIYHKNLIIHGQIFKMNGLDFLNYLKNKYPHCDVKLRIGIFSEGQSGILQLNNRNFTVPAYTDKNNLTWLTAFCGYQYQNEISNEQLKTLDVQGVKDSTNNGEDSTTNKGLLPFGFPLLSLPEWLNNLLLYLLIGFILFEILKHK